MKEISAKELNLDAMRIDTDWMLITAGTKERGYNTMTASWGHLGAIWGVGQGRMTSVVYVRPQRYTKEFIDREEYFTLSFFGPEYKKELALCGAKSGRELDKVKECGFTVACGEGGAPYFEQARLVLVCRKLYRAPVLEEGFVDKAVLEDCYPQRDFHDLYVGEIIKVLKAE